MAITNSSGLTKALQVLYKSALDFESNPLTDPLGLLWIHWDKCGKQSYSPGIAIWDGEE